MGHGKRNNDIPSKRLSAHIKALNIYIYITSSYNIYVIRIIALKDRLYHLETCRVC